jgi:hypothetical protein
MRVLWDHSPRTQRDRSAHARNFKQGPNNTDFKVKSNIENDSKTQTSEPYSSENGNGLSVSADAGELLE